MSIVLSINGEKRSFDADPRMSLLKLLRNHCQLTGAKDVCGEGFCGACTVLVDGEAVPSCLRPIGLLDKCSIVTVEGLSSSETLNSIQSIFLDQDVIQCGMCFPGMTMTLTALLSKNSRPTRNEIKIALTGNICRCTGYEKIIDAVISLQDF
jgi:carbon-monoxide dehydrogenase small subunit